MGEARSIYHLSLIRKKRETDLGLIIEKWKRRKDETIITGWNVFFLDDGNSFRRRERKHF
jgi:hypothetical protein